MLIMLLLSFLSIGAQGTGNSEAIVSVIVLFVIFPILLCGLKPPVNVERVTEFDLPDGTQKLDMTSRLHSRIGKWPIFCSVIGIYGDEPDRMRVCFTLTNSLIQEMEKLNLELYYILAVKYEGRLVPFYIYLDYRVRLSVRKEDPLIYEVVLLYPYLCEHTLFYYSKR